MKKPMLFGLVAAIAALGLLFAAIRSAQDEQKNAQPNPSALQNLTIMIDGETFTLSNGVAENESAPGSAGKNTLRLVGAPVFADVTGDGKPDAALLIRHDPGGSGTFYYAVLAINDTRSYRATNALPLGDRIVPQTVEVNDGRFVYRFLDREAGQSMADAPKLETAVSILVDPASGTISAAR